MNFDGPHMDYSKIPLPQDAQKVRPARPQRTRQAEAEVKVERRSSSDSLGLDLNLSLNLP